MSVFSFVGLQYGDWYSARLWVGTASRGLGGVVKVFEMIDSCDSEEG